MALQLVALQDGTFERFWAFWIQLWISESRFWALGTWFWSSGSKFLVHFGFLDSISDLLDSILGLGGVNFWPLRFDFRLEGICLGLQVSTLSWFWGPRSSTVQDWSFEIRFCAFGTQIWTSESRFWALGTLFWTPGSQFLVQFGIFDSISVLLDSILGLGGINCRPLGFDFRTWGYNLGPPGIDFVPILGLYSSRLDLWESLLCFRDSTLDPWESIFGADSILNPWKSISGPFWLLNTKGNCL